MIITAMVTPFIGDEVDYKGLERNIEFQLKAKVDGLLFLGSTGEAATVTEEERTKIIQLAVKAAKGKAKIMVGTGSNSTQKAITYTKEAEKLGADLALLVTPYYNCPTQEGIFYHFQAIGKVSALPLVVYNNPGRTARAISIDTLLRLSTLPTVVAIKEASGDIRIMQELLEKIDPKISLFTGDDNLAFCTRVLGGAGVISTTSNLLPHAMKELMQSSLPEARLLNLKLQPLFRALFIETNPIPLKVAMNHWSMAAGPCRLPLCQMKDPSKLLELLEHYGETKSAAGATTSALSF